MNVVMVLSTQFPPEEGIGNHVFNVSRKLIERGHNITVITRGLPTKTTRQLVSNIEVIKTNFVPIYPFHVWLHRFFSEKQIKKLVPQPDIIHLHAPLPPPVNTSKPLIVTFHSSLIEDAYHFEVNDARSLAIKLQTWSIGKNLMSKSIRKSDIVTTVSESVSSELKRYYDINCEPFIIGNGVDERAFMPSTFENERDYVLFVGRLSYRKGLFDILECARILNKIDLSFIFVGKGELEKKLKEKVRLAKLDSKVIFKGHVDHEELVKLYQGALALIVSSHYESGPLVLLEAMACGTPVIATCVGIVPKVIKSWNNGIIIPSRSPERMAQTILVLYEDDKLRRKMGSNARRTILEKYTWDDVTNRVEDCYDLLSDYG